ncbi:MAG: GGDEF domain-containing protein [Fibrobacteraceae bacterium]|nr:GGDEF domain-containing protein [Fibrobacteraceae bacterium]
MKREFNEVLARALAGASMATMLIDLDSNTYKIIHASASISSILGDEGRLDEGFKKGEEFLVAEPHRQQFREYTHLGNLRDWFKYKTSYSIEFCSCFDRWCRSRIFPIEIDSNKLLHKAIYFVNEIDDEAAFLREKLSIEETVSECSRALSSSIDVNISLNKLLSIIGKYHKSERVCIFSFDYKKKRMSNTHEWVQDGFKPKKDYLQNLPLGMADEWMEAFGQNQCKVITDIESLTHNSITYKVFVSENIRSMIAAPLSDGKKLIGYLSVSNPTVNIFKNTLLTSVASFVMNELQKKSYIDQLEHLSYYDPLTGLLNRNSYNKILQEIEKNKETNIGIIFGDLNGLKLLNDHQGHKAGDIFLRFVARKAKRFFEGLPYSNSQIFRIGGDEFVSIIHNIKEQEFDILVSEMLDYVEKKPLASIGDIWIKKCEDIESQIKMADKIMYLRKKAYYAKKGTDRRQR